MADKVITKRIIPYTDEQIAEADERIDQLEGLIAIGKDLVSTGVVSAEQQLELTTTLETARKIRSIMDRKRTVKK